MANNLLNRFQRKLRWIFIGRNPFLPNSPETKEIVIDEHYSDYYAKKYKQFIKTLPNYKSSHKHSNKVWWCWLQGEENAPPICKACLKSIRDNFKDREIIIITEDNYMDFIEIPDYIIRKYNNGVISRTHFSDIIRLELLIKYGGTWIDSSVLVTDYNKDYFDKDLFLFKTFMSPNSAIISSNWFITSEVGNPILRTTLDLLYKYWQKNNGVDRYYVFHIFLKYAAEKYHDIWQNIPVIPNTPPHVMQFELNDKYSDTRWKQICSMSSIHKLSQKRDGL